MKLKKLLLSVVGGMLPLAMSAMSVVITTVTGDTFTIPIESVPKVMVSEGKIVVEQTENATLTFEMKDCPKFTIQETGAIENLGTPKPEIRYTDRVLILSGFQPASPVTIYSMSGIIAASGKTDSEGGLVMELYDITPGIYIVNTSLIKTKLSIK